MSSAHAFSHQLAIPSIPNVTPIVFVIDDDISVQQSLEKVIGRQGWQPETFASR